MQATIVYAKRIVVLQNRLNVYHRVMDRSNWENELKLLKILFKLCVLVDVIQQQNCHLHIRIFNVILINPVSI